MEVEIDTQVISNRGSLKYLRSIIPENRRLTMMLHNVLEKVDEMKACITYLM